MDAKTYAEMGFADKVGTRLAEGVPPQLGFTDFLTDAGVALAGGFFSQILLDSVRRIFDINSLVGDIGEPLLVMAVSYALKRMRNDMGDGYRWADQLAAGMIGAMAGKFGQAVSGLLTGKLKAPSNAIGMLNDGHYAQLADLTMDALQQSGQFVPQTQAELDTTRNALRSALPVAARWASAM